MRRAFVTLNPSSELEGQWRWEYRNIEPNSKGNGEGPDEKFATLNPSSGLEGQQRRRGVS